jgi:hypothetical protein
LGFCAQFEAGTSNRIPEVVLCNDLARQDSFLGAFMIKYICSAALVFIGQLLMSQIASAADSAVPEPFQRFDDSSSHMIRYADLNAVLKKVVVDTGRSSREKAEAPRAKTGTRMKANVKRSTINEGNRFYYEAFTGDQETQQVLRDVQTALEGLPAEVPLQYFSRNEQLAYWLNLYNVTLISEIVKVYPERKLKKLLTGKNSILEKKILTVAGVPLSLDDIQYTILKQNYDNDPLVMYGLYQGIIGGPNIRKSAYTGANVQRNLANNAAEFINSNRGTYAKDEKVFRASSLYDRNRGYFTDFQGDLKKHLLVYLQGPERGELQAAKTIKPDISDWTVTDLYGSYPQIGGSLAGNSAAMLGSVGTSVVGEKGGVVAAPSSANSNRIQARTSAVSYVSPELIVYLREIKVKQDASNLDKAHVTVEELGEVPVEPGPDSESNPDDQENNQPQM